MYINYQKVLSISAKMEISLHNEHCATLLRLSVCDIFMPFLCDCVNGQECESFLSLSMDKSIEEKHTLGLCFMPSRVTSKVSQQVRSSFCRESFRCAIL